MRFLNTQELLRNTYGKGFHLLGMSKANAQTILDPDNNEKEKNGRHSGEVYQQADYFINAGDSSVKMQRNIFGLSTYCLGIHL